MRKQVTDESTLITRANVLDARAAAGDPSALRRRNAIVGAARVSGYSAQSATQAAIQNLTQGGGIVSFKQMLREDINEVQQALADGIWPTDVTVTNSAGEQVTTFLANEEEAIALLRALMEHEVRMESLSPSFSTSSGLDYSDSGSSLTNSMASEPTEARAPAIFTTKRQPFMRRS